MANFSLQIEPTESNAYESLVNDTLGNNSWINKCLNILLQMDNSIVAFDGDWGNGKTFLAKQFQMVINEKFNMKLNGKTQRQFNNINGLDFENIIENSCYAIYYNAWEYDNDNDSVSSFLYYLLKKLNKEINSSKFKKVAVNLIKNVIEKASSGWIKIDEDGKKNTIEDVLSSVIETETIREEIKKLLDELKTEKYDNLIIFIDELDRCRPTYALKVIEMIKHYLKMDNILIVCMTDIKQLSNCISSIYGGDYDSNMYLDKIFDCKFSIPSVKYNKSYYISKKLGMPRPDGYCFQIVCLEIIDYFNLSLRNIDKYLLYVGNEYKSPKDSGIYFEISTFVNSLFVPYFIAANLFNQKLYYDLMNENLDDYLKFCRREKILEKLKQIYKENDESKLFDYFSHDCKLFIRQIKGERYINEEYFIKAGSARIIENFLERIDILEFFISNTMNNN